MTYRPTVRYDDRYCDYIDQLHDVTTLSRAQIIRLALFSAPFSPLFNAQIGKFSKCEVSTSSPPSPMWEVVDRGLWMEQSFIKEEEKGSDVNGNQEEICIIGEQPSEGRIGEVHKVRNAGGGITIKIR